MAKLEKPSALDLKSLVGTAKNVICGAANSSNNIETQTGAIRILSSPGAQAQILKAKDSTELQGDVRELGQGMRTLASKVLEGYKINTSRSIEKQLGDFGSLLYNPNQGKFEVIPNMEKIRQSQPVSIPTGMGVPPPVDNLKYASQSLINKVQPDIDKLNQALTLYSNSAKIYGSDANDLEIRQYAANKYGYKTNPSYAPYRVQIDKFEDQPEQKAAPSTNADGWSVEPWDGK
jgi:hypothetical protein